NSGGAEFAWQRAGLAARDGASAAKRLLRATRTPPQAASDRRASAARSWLGIVKTGLASPSVFGGILAIADIIYLRYTVERTIGSPPLVPRRPPAKRSARGNCRCPRGELRGKLFWGGR